MLAILIIMFIFILFLPNEIRAEKKESLILTSTTDKLDVYENMFILVDQDKKRTISDVVSPSYEGEFQPSHLIEQKGGFFSTSKWIRFQVDNRSSSEDKWLLEIAFHLIPKLILFEETATGVKEIIHTGTERPFYERDIDHRNFVFHLPINEGETKTFYIFLHAGGDMHPPIHIWNSNAFLKKTQTEFILLGIFYGIVSVMVLYNLFLYFGLRMKSYLYYVLIIFCTIIANLENNGLGFQYIWPNSPFWNSMSNPLFVSFSCVFMLLFTRSFLNTDLYYPRFKKYSYILMGANGLVIVLLFISNPIALNVMLVSVASTFIFVLGAGIFCLLRGARQARFFVLAWFIYLTGIFITIITTAAIIPYSLIAEYAAQISISLEVILLSLALADNINIIRKEKVLAEREVIESQKLVVESLKEADELKDEFLAITSHELRTPLYGMIGIAESIRDGVAGGISSKLEEQLSLIITSGNRLTGLVNDILDFSKLKNNVLRLHLKPANLSEIVEIVFMISRQLIKYKPIQLVNHISSSLPPVMVDQNRLQQILYNLIENAIKYSDDGTIDIYAEQRDNRVFLCISDEGRGIPKDQLVTIFESFQQGEATLSRDASGIGIGLNIAKKLVELHGGVLDVKSKVGHGSLFSFSLAIQSEDEREVAQEAALSLEPALFDQAELTTPNVHIVEKKATILVADDEPVNLQVLMNQLMLEGYEVITALNGEEVLQKMSSYQVDLLILDVMMPKISGYEVCQRLRKNYSLMDLPILMLTAKNQIYDKVTSFDVGANDYLTKPCDKQELLSRVRTLIRMKSLNQALIELNQDLERKIIERTEALQIANEDLTKMYEDLTRMTESRRQLLANISHELGTPITLIHSYLQAIQNNLVQVNDSYFRDLVNDKMKVLDRLINDLSDLSTLEAGEASLIRNEINTEEWLETVYLQQEFDIIRYNRQVEQYINKDEMSAYYCSLDEERMNQVFSNIIRNAVKNTKNETGKIKLAAEIDHQNKELVIQITDNGSGISKDNLPYIFERFYKGTLPTAPNAQRGTGLGLAIVKEIIYAHEGQVWAKSTIDQGTTFFIALPVYRKERH